MPRRTTPEEGISASAAAHDPVAKERPVHEEPTVVLGRDVVAYDETGRILGPKLSEGRRPALTLPNDQRERTAVFAPPPVRERRSASRWAIPLGVLALVSAAGLVGVRHWRDGGGATATSVTTSGTLRQIPASSAVIVESKPAAAPQNASEASPATVLAQLDRPEKVDGANANANTNAHEGDTAHAEPPTSIDALPDARERESRTEARSVAAPTAQASAGGGAERSSRRTPHAAGAKTKHSEIVRDNPF